MSSATRNRRRHSRRRGTPRRTAWPGGQANETEPSCGVCDKPITDITVAIAKPDNHQPVHFECVLDIVAKEMKPGNDEMIIYLGKGSFAVVEAEAYRRKKLIVRRQVDWESIENRGDWRMKLRAKIL